MYIYITACFQNISQKKKIWLRVEREDSLKMIVKFFNKDYLSLKLVNTFHQYYADMKKIIIVVEL